MANLIEPILIVGGAGFVGKYLIDYCKDNGLEFYVTKLPQEEIEDVNSDLLFDLDILDIQAVKDVIEKANPKSIIHLAAQSSVGLSWKNMHLTVDVNIKGSINIFQAVEQIDKKIRILVIGSSEEYGKIDSVSCRIEESHATNPMNPYAITKTTQTMIARMFHEAYGLDVVIMRAFNHIGPGQKLGFVVPDFCSQIVDIEKGITENKMLVGNLSAMRDFTDVRDIVKGYVMALKFGKSGEIYNIGSGEAVSIQSILDLLLGMANVTIQIEQDINRMRPSDVKLIEADISKLQGDTGYKPEIPLSVTLLDTLNYYRGLI